jgi:hypothetical protein
MSWLEQTEAEPPVLPSLVGQTFLARLGRHAVAMIVEKEELGWCYGKSLDLQHTGRWPSDAVRREVARQRSEAEANDA